MRTAGLALVVVGAALVVFYLFSFQFSGSGLNGADKGWGIEVGYDRSSRIGLASGTVLLVAGLLMEREAKRK